MSITKITKNRFFSSVLILAVLGLPLAAGMYLAWDEWQYRKAVSTLPVLVPVNTTKALPGSQAFNPEAIASVLGLSSRDVQVTSAEALKLIASFVSSHGTSQALLAGAEGSRFYKVGERLPGGSVLRRVGTAYVVLWHNGREEWLVLRPAAAHLLPVSNVSAPVAPSSSSHLRPIAEQP